MTVRTCLRIGLATWVCALAPARAQWPGFRGDAALTGCAPVPLSTNLALRWTRKVGRALSAAPVLDAGRLLVGSDDKGLYALNPSDGAVLWRFGADDGIEAAPLIADEAVYVGTGSGTLFAVSLTNGVERWRFQTGEKILGAANVVRDESGRARVIVVGSYDFRVYGLDPRDGRKVWDVETENYINGGPAVASGGRVVFGGCDALLHVVAGLDGRELAAHGAGSYVAAAPAVRDGRIFAGNYGGSLLCVALESGETLWEFANAEAAPFFSSAAVGVARVVAGARDGRLYALDAATGKERWAFTTDGDVDTSPVICGDAQVLAGTQDGRVVLLALSDGRELWSARLGGTPAGAFAVADGWFYTAASDGLVYAFGPPATAPGPAPAR